MSGLEGGPDAVKLDFLHPLVHYIKPIFAATSAPEHSAALAAVQAYLDACLNENQTAVRQLSAERARLHQICQAPQYEGRYCGILCRDVNAGARAPGHHSVLTGIEEALKELAVEENLINLWRIALGQPLHCLQHQSYQVFYAPQTAVHRGQRVPPRVTTVTAAAPTRQPAPAVTSAAQHQPENLARPRSVSVVTVCTTTQNAQ